MATKYNRRMAFDATLELREDIKALAKLNDKSVNRYMNDIMTEIVEAHRKEIEKMKKLTKG